MSYKIRIGYACINTMLREIDVFTSRSMILKTAEEKGIEYVKELAEKNVDDLMKIIIYNEAHGIRFFRISSNVFPHIGNPKLDFGDYDLGFLKNKLKTIGKYAKRNGHRLTMHPGQFVQLGSPRESVVQQSIIDLVNHAKLLHYMDYSPNDNSVLIVHGGGTFGDKEETLERWRRNFLSMPKNVREYISLENDENSYGIMDLLPFCEQLSIPFCLDIFHNQVSEQPVELSLELIARIFNTWKVRNMIPKIHISEQQPGLRRGAHSKTIDELPEYVLQWSSLLKTDLDIMLEVKDKEVSVFKMYYKYFDTIVHDTGKITYELADV